MVTLKNKSGEEHEFHLDWSMAVKMDVEEKVNIFQLLDQLDSDEFSFYTIDRLSKLMGHEYPEFVKMGYTFEDLAMMIGPALEELGFISEEQEPTTSTTGLRAGPAD